MQAEDAAGGSCSWLPSPGSRCNLQSVSVRFALDRVAAKALAGASLGGQRQDDRQADGGDDANSLDPVDGEPLCAALAGGAPASISLPPCSPASRPLRTASDGGLRPVLTQAALGDSETSGRGRRKRRSTEQRNIARMSPAATPGVYFKLEGKGLRSKPSSLRLISNAAKNAAVSKPPKSGTHRKLLEMGVGNVEAGTERSPAHSFGPSFRRAAGKGGPPTATR